MKIYLKRNTEFNGKRLLQGYHDLPEADAESLIKGEYATTAPAVSPVTKPAPAPVTEAAQEAEKSQPVKQYARRKSSGGVNK